MSALQRPNVFDYQDPKEFIQAMVDYYKLGKGVSIRRIHERGGLKSSNYIQMIIDGKRRLGPKAVGQLGKSFELSGSEQKFFHILVLASQERLPSRKKAYMADLEEYRAYRQIKPSAEAIDDFYSFWYISAIFEACNTDWGKKSTSEMAKSVGISESEVNHAFEILQNLKLIEKKNNLWRKTKHAFVTPKQMQSTLVRKYHREMGLQAVRHIEATSPEERELGAITVMLTPQSYEKIKRLLWNLREEIARSYTSDEGASLVYQLNFQLFPLVRIKG